jgi:hypothetical protein
MAGIDLEKLEEAFNGKDLHEIPVEQHRKVHNVFIDSTIGSTARLVIATNPTIDSKNAPRENKI